MAQIYIKYNPYRLETEITVNGDHLSNDSILKAVKGKRLQEWIGNFPQMLVDELNTVDFDITFCGMPLDWDDLEYAFNHAYHESRIKSLNLNFIEGRSDEEITNKIVRVFTDLQEGPIEDFKDPKLVKAFESIHNSVFPINVIATMSSGKSTLINALLENKLMPSKNEACTAIITEILDNDTEQFSAVVYDEDGNILQEVPELTYDIMDELNANEKTYKITAKGNIPFLDANDTALMLVDTPGPNNSQNQAHKNTTYRAINNDSNSLILYVLNGTQLSTNDDASLLSYVAEQIKKGGKQVRDRFLFVINKMDGFNPEQEDIGKAIEAAKKYLGNYGIEDPQIFPCSAYTALNIKTYFEGININHLTREEEKKLPIAARDTLPMIDKFIEFESMHLEQYSTLSPSAQRELNFRLSQAEKNDDIKEQALIHCGICSIESAITAYVKKYAKTKKVKDLVESFEEVVESTQVLANAKAQVMEDEEVAKACAEKASAIKATIADGKEAKKFKKKIKELDPMKNIEIKTKDLQKEAVEKTSRIFNPYGDTITSREEAKRLVNQFTMMSSDHIAELTAELESVINKELIETGEKLLKEYQEKLENIDKTLIERTENALNFDTVDLIKGTLKNMHGNITAWCSDDFATDIVENVGGVTYEERVYHEKVGQEEEEVYDGTEQVYIGKKLVKSGSHKEKIGTTLVKNTSKKWFQFWKPEYVNKDLYETVDDYKEEDVYETKAKFKTVMRDIYEERREQIEKFSVEVSDIQSGLVSKLREQLDKGIEAAESYARTQIITMKKQFMKLFDQLDALIQEKYTELENCTRNQKTKEAELEKNSKLLKWIEACKREIDEILEI